MYHGVNLKTSPVEIDHRYLYDFAGSPLNRMVDRLPLRLEPLGTLRSMQIGQRSAPPEVRLCITARNPQWSRPFELPDSGETGSEKG